MREEVPSSSTRSRDRDLRSGQAPPWAGAGLRGLVLAAGVQRRQDEQVRKSKEPVVGLLPCGGNRTLDEADVAGARQIVEMLEADAGQVGGLRVREDFLTGLDLDHGWPSLVRASRKRPVWGVGGGYSASRRLCICGSSRPG